MNGTVAILAEQIVVAKSECALLDSMYMSNWWEWQNYADYHAGYQVRDNSATYEMPILRPVLNSIDPVWPLCGSVVYTFYDDPQNVNLV